MSQKPGRAPPRGRGVPSMVRRYASTARGHRGAMMSETSEPGDDRQMTIPSSARFLGIAGRKTQRHHGSLAHRAFDARGTAVQSHD